MKCMYSQQREGRSDRAKSGFTLAEVAVTIIIVGIVLVVSLEGLNNSMFQAAHTRDMKIARELGLFTLGQVESGLFAEDIEDHMGGDYSDQEYKDFTWELVFGDEAFDEPEEETEGAFDSWAPTDEEEDEDEDAEQPYETVRVKVTFPGPKQAKNELTLEQWITWSFVYGEEDPEEQP